VTLRQYKTDVAENQKMLGTIVDTEGKPIVGAVVFIGGAKQGDRTWWGRVEQTERASITDEEGKFLLTSEAPYEQWALTVRAAGYCQKKTNHQPTGSTPYEIALQRGTTVTGTVIDQAGKPVSNHNVGMLQRVRHDLERWVGERTIATDDKGRFTFTAMVPDCEWVIYSAIEGRDDVEFFQSEFFDSDKNEAVQDLGKFNIKGHGKVTGKLFLPAGESLPKELRVTISRKHAWRSQTATVKSDGSFQFPNLPLNEPLEIRIYAEGFKASPDQQELQTMMENELGLMLDKDQTYVEIPLVKEGSTDR